MFYVDVTSPPVMAFLTDPHSLSAPYTNTMMSDALDDKLERRFVLPSKVNQGGV